MGLQAKSIKLTNPPGELETAFLAANKDRMQAMLVVTASLFFRDRERIGQLSSRSRIPTMFARREFVEAGGLMSYGPNIPAMFRRAAHFVDRIVKGANPGDLPMEQPDRFDLVVNMKTAKALGLAIAQSVLLRADQIIE
jgi:putative ABC transport system substrate-binding protein